jgi:ribosomal protein S18 acetylase RimI-like enzyme
LTLTVDIRPAIADDAQDLAAFHVRIWRETYRGVAPAEAYALLDEARRCDRWRASLSGEKPGMRTLLATLDGRIVGFVAFGPPGAEIFGDMGEVMHLYVDSALAGRGLGKRLLGLAFDGLAAAGYRRAGLAVVAENANARAFYRAQGGAEIGKFTDPGPLWRSENVLVAWTLPVARPV